MACNVKKVSPNSTHDGWSANSTAKSEAATNDYNECLYTVGECEGSLD